MRRTVLVAGSGAREHALAWKLRQSLDLGQLYSAPGNAGTGEIARNVPLDPTNISEMVRFVEERDVDLTVIGPEAPLALGLADALRARGHRVFGPNAAAARLESSKAFAKDRMRACGVPTAAYAVFDRPDDALAYLARCSYPLVVKADGLAAGKGVSICGDEADARTVVLQMMVAGRYGTAGGRVVLEEALEGPEISLMALVAGEEIVPLPLAQDHKRLGAADTGPNTGGMGAYAPVPFISPQEQDRLVQRTLQPVVSDMATRGTPYSGVLYAGLMLTADGPRVLEFNCRFGDPEAQVLLPLLAGDLLPRLEQVAEGGHLEPVPTTGSSAVGVVLAAPGYPDAPEVGDPVEGLDIPGDALVFHAGTALDPSGRLVTAGGRVLTVVGLGDDVDDAVERAYDSPVRFRDMQRRPDIAYQARKVAAHA